MKSKIEQIEYIHESLLNGQRQQCVRLIDEYGLYDFFEDYEEYLKELYNIDDTFKYYSDLTQSYFRIKNR